MSTSCKHTGLSRSGFKKPFILQPVETKQSNQQIIFDLTGPYDKILSQKGILIFAFF